MPNYSIALGVRAPEVEDLTTAHAKVASLRSMFQQQKAGELQLEAAERANAQSKQADADDKTAREIFARHTGPDGTLDQKGVLADLYKAGNVKGAGAFTAQIQAQRTAALDAQKKAIEVAKEKNAMIGRGAGAVMNAAEPDRPAIYARVRAELIQSGIDPAQLPEAYDPALVQAGYAAAIDADKQLTAAQQKLVAEETARHNGVVETNTATTAAETKRHNLATEQTAQQQVSARLAEVAKANTPAELAVVASDPNRTPAEREVAKAALKVLERHAVASRPVNTTAVTAELSPEAIAMLARNVAAGGQMPPLGRNAGGTIAKVLNQAAGQDPNLNIAGARAGYKADAGALVALQKQRDSVAAFENTALKNLDQFLAVSKGVVDTGSPWLNTPLRQINEKMLGSADATAFNVARQVAVTEIAKVLSNPGTSGVLSDSARHEVQELIGPNATLAQIVRAANILKADMQNRAAAMDAQISEIKERIGGGAPAAPTNTGGSRGGHTPAPAARPAAGITVTDPNGGVHTFPNQAAADNFKRLAGIR